MPHPTATLHPMAVMDGSVEIGARTTVWQFASIIRGARIGEDCKIASGAVIDGAKIGDRCVICQNVSLPPGVVVGNDVFIGASAVFCNDVWPRVGKDGFDMKRFADGFVTVRLEDGASVGAGAIILPGVVIGKGALVAAGAVVNGNVPAGRLWVRNGTTVAIEPSRAALRMREAGCSMS